MQNAISSTGKLIRMRRIFKQDDKAVMVAINHGLGLGPIKGIEELDELIASLVAEGCDSLTIHKGIAMRYAEKYADKTALILKVTNRTKYFTPFEIPIATVEEAAAIGADALAVGISLCDEREDESIMQAAKFVEDADSLGIPTVAHSYPNGNLITDDERFEFENVAYATRVAQELGIDIIKTFWTGSAKTFEQIVKIGSPCKVVLSGGPKCNTLRECFDMTYQCMQAGANGITYGRNIWQHDYPGAVLRGLNAIVHDNESVDTALDIASDCAGVKLT